MPRWDRKGSATQELQQDERFAGNIQTEKGPPPKQLVPGAGAGDAPGLRLRFHWQLEMLAAWSRPPMPGLDEAAEGGAALCSG